MLFSSGTFWSRLRLFFAFFCLFHLDYFDVFWSCITLLGLDVTGVLRVSLSLRGTHLRILGHSLLLHLHCLFKLALPCWHILPFSISVANRSSPSVYFLHIGV